VKKSSFFSIIIARLSTNILENNQYVKQGVIDKMVAVFINNFCYQ